MAVTMCLMEVYFPLSFFDVMSHLIFHLVEELDICGPVALRWMYPVERFMKTLKKHMKNTARPEASIAHGYLVDECLGFITEYMHGFKPVSRRVWDEDAEDGDEYEKTEGGDSTLALTPAMRTTAHEYMLRNNTLMAPLYR